MFRMTVYDSQAMPETTLHQQLKALYCSDESSREVTMEGYRIDAVVGDELIEIQCAGLSAIRDKIKKLCKTHKVRVVKPLCESKLLLKKNRKGGKIVSRRRSPLHENYFDIFDELVHFTKTFPHKNLTFEVLLTEQEEIRLPPIRKGRRRRLRQRVEDRRLVSVTGRLVLKSNADLLRLLPESLPTPFTTGDLANHLEIPRWLAQKMAYCLRHSKAVSQVGKKGNAILYKPMKVRKRRKRSSAA